jgi:DNA-binding transcriptional ArsR family regulator
VRRNFGDSEPVSSGIMRGVSCAIGSLDPDIASAAALIGDASRALILSALADGRALPAGELARIARISPQTASSHLDKLFKGNLVSVEVQGRHHYYRLRDSHVAELLESLSIVARPIAPLTSAQRERAEQLRFARTCYGHLAGRLGVAITQALCTNKYLCNEGWATKCPPRASPGFARSESRSV